MEQVSFCTSVADCQKRGEAALQVADYSDRLQSIYAANEALRLSPNNPDVLLLRARGYATAGIAQDDDNYKDVNFCELAANDAHRREKSELETIKRFRRFMDFNRRQPCHSPRPYFYCAEYAKANPARI